MADTDGGKGGSRGGPLGSGAPAVSITPWPGSSLGPKIYTITVQGAASPGVNPPPNERRQGSGVPPVPGRQP